MAKRKDLNAKHTIAQQKVPIGLYPNVARIETCLVFAQSAPYYGEFNWRNCSLQLSTYLDAIDRHLIALRAGEDRDRESGLYHAAHINACTAIIMEAKQLGILSDDRFAGDPSAARLHDLTPPTYRLAKRTLVPTPARRVKS